MDKMDDLISRRAAIDELVKMLGYCFQADGEVIDAVVTTINDLPPAQPKTGKWIQDRSGAYCCSECMEPCATYVMMKPRDRFCKMCEAKMEVTE